MNASSLPLTVPAPQTGPRERRKSTRSTPKLPILSRQRAPDVFVRLAILSLGLHALAVAGAWLRPAEPPVKPARPDPVTLVTLAPVAAPQPPAVPPQATPQPPRPAPPKPAAKPVTRPAPRPTSAPLIDAPVPAPAPNSPADAPVAATDATASPPPQATEATTAAPVAIDLHAAYRLNPAPEYPPLALRRGWQGTVRLRVALDPEGHPTNVDLAASSGYPMLDESALATVRRWRFSPATRSGKPVAATVEVPIVFKISR